MRDTLRQATLTSATSETCEPTTCADTRNATPETLADEKDGRAIADSVDPNVSNDVCTFCRHAKFGELFDPPECQLGHASYFRSLSDMGPIWVSDCQSGELRPELAALEKHR
jgi:hypothetical protein